VDPNLVRDLRALPDHPEFLFHPVEDRDEARSGALNWYLLIRAMEEFSRVTGSPLADAWEHVRRAEYHEACTVFDVSVQRWRKARSARRR
jgi:hypothetical protein